MRTTTTTFDASMYQAALVYYGLPSNYGRTFTQEPVRDPKPGQSDTWLKSCSVPSASRGRRATWVQVNQPRAGKALTGKEGDERRYFKKASNEDIGMLANITLDFEYPQDPSKALAVGQGLMDYLIE